MQYMLPVFFQSASQIPLSSSLEEEDDEEDDSCEVCQDKVADCEACRVSLFRFVESFG